MIKFIVLIASVAIASSAHIDLHEHIANEMQKQIDLTNFQNEKIREHQELTFQQRQMQLEQLNDQRRVQEQLIRDHEQQRKDLVRDQYHRHNVQFFVHPQPAVVNIPSSSRHFNVHDDSNYDFRYAVTDMTTGDMKSHKELRHGDNVQGQYTMMDSDGYHRTVNYSANDRDGFDAEVRREQAVPVIGFIHNRYNGFTNYHGHHNQHNFNSNNNQEQWNYSHRVMQPVTLIPQPFSVATTSVSKVDDGQYNQYTTKTTTA